MSGKWISLLLLSLTAAAPASGGNQSRPLNMETLSVVDGLSSNYVYAITQDRAGYMWFGTENGLDRYDGKTIRHYQHFPDNPQSLSDSRVNCLLSSADGSLLVGTEKGINIYVPEKDILTPYAPARTMTTPTKACAKSAPAWAGSTSAGRRTAFSTSGAAKRPRTSPRRRTVRIPTATEDCVKSCAAAISCRCSSWWWTSGSSISFLVS